MSTGTIVGIVLGSLAGVLLLCGLLFYWMSRLGNGPSARPAVVRRAGFSSLPTEEEMMMFEATKLNLRI